MNLLHSAVFVFEISKRVLNLARVLGLTDLGHDELGPLGYVRLEPGKLRENPMQEAGGELTLQAGAHKVHRMRGVQQWMHTIRRLLLRSVEGPQSSIQVMLTGS